MTKQQVEKSSAKLVSLLIIEGDTEQIFYSIVRDKDFNKIPCRTYNIRGQGNINRQIVGRIQLFVRDNSADTVRVYCCIDAERNKRSATPLDLRVIRGEVCQRKLRSVLSVDEIVADPDIESWFFYDIDGIYKFLRARHSQRNPRRYRNPSNFCKRDLQQLFNQFDKVYLSGRRAENFINNLDFDKIVSGCKELREGIEKIKSQADDTTNYLFKK